MEQILNSYYADNARKLHKVVDRILLKFGGLSNKDMDDFYSLANEVFTDVLKRYDESQSFDAFLYSCLSNKIKSEITKRNCFKRLADRKAISINTPISNDNDCTLGDMIADNFDLEREVFGEEDVDNSQIEKYLCRLSKRQREIVCMLAVSYKAVEIQQILSISKREYDDAISGICAYENTKILL